MYITHVVEDLDLEDQFTGQLGSDDFDDEVLAHFDRFEKVCVGIRDFFRVSFLR
jgi:hypothetical protein